MNEKKYYSLATTGRTADIAIYGDITSWPWMETDMSAWLLSKQIADLDVDEINICINSYGGEVAEGWAIYNALKRHKAKVHTIVDGFACSIASVIFMAGEKRTMNGTSVLMIHQPSGGIRGTAEDMRKEAKVLDQIGELSAATYLEHVSLSADELKKMLDEETWISPTQALQHGFATDIVTAKADTITQSARESVLASLTSKERPAQKQAEQKQEETPKAVTLSEFFNF